ncbi:MAG: glycosyltransferase family 4 protein [Candidatus Aminicenantes bacterium]|nr:glycosyltransferase family 4 protein [Candidatus Aminicenantes bacterium]
MTSPYQLWPDNCGCARRTLNIAKALTRLGHSVKLLSRTTVNSDMDLGPEGEWKYYSNWGASGHFFNPSFLSGLDYFLHKKNISMIVASFPYQTMMVIRKAREAGLPVVYDAHNVEANRFKFTHNPFKAYLVQKTEAYLCKHAQAVLTVSSGDCDLMEFYYGVKSYLLPNGVNTRYFTPGEKDRTLVSLYQLEDRQVVLYFGNYDYKPNREALHFLIERIWPTVKKRYPKAILMTIGRNPPSWVNGNPDIIATGAVDDITSHLRLANVVVIPLMKGGGTRLKILEALSCAQVVLSTPKGASGIEGVDQKGLIVVPHEDFAEKLIDLLEQNICPCSNEYSRQIAKKYEWQQLVGNIDWESLSSMESQ